MVASKGVLCNLLSDAAAHATYTTLFDQWHAVYGRFLEMGDAGLLRPLWKPAGA